MNDAKFFYDQSKLKDFVLIQPSYILEDPPLSGLDVLRLNV
jgi:hypothetical protein